MVPDNEIAGINVCQYSKNDIYRHQTVKLSYSTHLVKRCCNWIITGMMISGSV